MQRNADELWSVTPTSPGPVPCARPSDCSASYLPLIEALPRCRDDWTFTHPLLEEKHPVTQTPPLAKFPSCPRVLFCFFFLMTFEVWSCVTVRAGSCISVGFKGHGRTVLRPVEAAVYPVWCFILGHCVGTKINIICLKVLVIYLFFLNVISGGIRYVFRLAVW